MKRRGHRGWGRSWRPPLAAAVPLCCAIFAGCSARESPAPEQVFGVQLHLHGSMSEGAGSMAGHNHAARQLGGAVDVLWWTDHDWRISTHTYVTGFDFEDKLQTLVSVPAPFAPSEWDRPGLPGDPQEVVKTGWRMDPVANPARSLRLKISDAEAREGKKSLSFSVEGDEVASGVGKLGRDGPRESWQSVALSFGAERRRHIASLASGVRVRLSVMPIMPAPMDEKARIVVSFLLSQHPPDFRGRLDYRLVARHASAGAAEGSGADTDERQRVIMLEADGAALPTKVGTIDVDYEPGVWNDLVFDVTGDAQRLALGGEDNSLAGLSLLFEVRPGGRVEGFVDELKIERERVGVELLEEEKRLAQAMGGGAIVNHVGQEISYAAHLNAYGPDVPLADPVLHPHGYTPVEAVEMAHRHGGIVSLNHVFGIGTGSMGHNFEQTRPSYDARVAQLVERRAYGADLLEVGYRSRGYGLAAFVELWDALSKAGSYVTGVGVSDSHDNDVGWHSGPNNFITWVLASSSSQGDLIEALRAGRAYFGDPTHFDGRVDIMGPGDSRMGEVAVVRPGRQKVTYRAEGLRKGQRVRIIRDGLPTRNARVQGKRFELSEEIEVRGPTFVRFEVMERGEPVVLSNPLYFALEPPAENEGRVRVVR